MDFETVQEDIARLLARTIYSSDDATIPVRGAWMRAAFASERGDWEALSGSIPYLAVFGMTPDGSGSDNLLGIEPILATQGAFVMRVIAILQLTVAVMEEHGDSESPLVIARLAQDRERYGAK